MGLEVVFGTIFWVVFGVIFGVVLEVLFGVIFLKWDETVLGGGGKRGGEGWILWF